MIAAKSKTRGYTLVEVLIVIAIMGLLATLLLPGFGPQVHNELSSAAAILAADLNYARSLASTNNSKYCLVFELTQNRYVLEHSGTNTLLEALPNSPFRLPGDSPDKQTTDFDELPGTGPQVEIVAARTAGNSPQNVTQIEFGPLGGTTQTAATTVWLGCGQGENRRYLSVTVDAITGLATVGDLQQVSPLAAPASNPGGSSTLPLGN